MVLGKNTHNGFGVSWPMSWNDICLRGLGHVINVDWEEKDSRKARMNGTARMAHDA